MTFRKADIVRYERTVVDGQVTRLFVACMLQDDATNEERYVEFEVEGPQLAALKGLKNAPAQARRNAFLGWLRPRIKAAHRDWMAERAARPVVETLGPAGADTDWGTTEIDSLE